MSSTVEIQQYNCKTGEYENLPIGAFKAREMTVGGEFKIVVDGDTIYHKGGEEN